MPPEIQKYGIRLHNQISVLLPRRTKNFDSLALRGFYLKGGFLFFMIRHLYYVHSHDTNPYANLALEETLLHAVEPGECILYLWQNQRTVVIGRNQNAWAECRVEELEQRNNGFLARRLSGGGAVYHDMGNLNFTFLVCQEDYDLSRQMEVILQAVKSFGISAECSGRNDILAEGKKCSGNAFYSAGEKRYHHGTLLIDVDIENLSRYLNVSAGKLQSKGVSSVKSRVGNLSGLSSGEKITVKKMRERLLDSFGNIYGLAPAAFPEARMDREFCRKAEQKFSSWDWKFGRSIPFTVENARRFSWGHVQIQLQVNNGKIKDAAVYSDAMDVTLIKELPALLKGRMFSSQDLEKTADTLLQYAPTADTAGIDVPKSFPESSDALFQMIQDVRSMLLYWKEKL